MPPEPDFHHIRAYVCLFLLTDTLDKEHKPKIHGLSVNPRKLTNFLFLACVALTTLGFPLAVLFCRTLTALVASAVAKWFRGIAHLVSPRLASHDYTFAL